MLFAFSDRWRGDRGAPAEGRRWGGRGGPKALGQPILTQSVTMDGAVAKGSARDWHPGALRSTCWDRGPKGFGRPAFTKLVNIRARGGIPRPSASRGRQGLGSDRGIPRGTAPGLAEWSHFL